MRADIMSINFITNLKILCRSVMLCSCIFVILLSVRAIYNQKLRHNHFNNFIFVYYN
jgi:hypothetical protein